MLVLLVLLVLVLLVLVLLVLVLVLVLVLLRERLMLGLCGLGCSYALSVEVCGVCGEGRSEVRDWNLGRGV